MFGVQSFSATHLLSGDMLGRILSQCSLEAVVYIGYERGFLGEVFRGHFLCYHDTTQSVTILIRV